LRGLPVQELRPGSGSSLFVFGGVGGSTDEVARVAAFLPPGRRVVALAPVAEPTTTETVTDSTESMAASAVEAIRSEQADGPYLLLGYSFGGLLALEAADLLATHGERVEFVGLLDTIFDQSHWPAGLFARAVLRRTAHHARGLVGRPPAEAVSELSHRARQLARRLRGRRHAPAVAPIGETAVSDANLAVMWHWRPRVFDQPVTLFAATDAVFGCDLADLWRPWLPRLEVRRVWGNHVDLTSTDAGASRVARAVMRALEPADRLEVLVACTFDWAVAARLAVDLHDVGCRVTGVAPRRSPLHTLTATERTFGLGLLDPLGSLERAIVASAAELVIPCDDRTRHALSLLHARTDSRTATGMRLREVIERSLGSLGDVYSRVTLSQVARECGVVCPATEEVRSADDLDSWFERHPGQAVLKVDGSWGGRGVAVVDSPEDGRRAWTRMRRRPSLARAIKRLLLERDPWSLRTRLLGPRPIVSIQAFIEGRPANAAVACVQGTALATVQAEVVESCGRTGPSTVLRLIDHADMVFAAKSIVSQLNLTGLCGLDFVIDDRGHAHLLELNPRATPTSHLIGADGADLLTSLRSALGYDDAPARESASVDPVVALFPQELMRDPGSRYVSVAHHDVPEHAPELVAHVTKSLRKR